MKGGIVHQDLTIFGEGTLTFQEFAMREQVPWQASIKQYWSICAVGMTWFCSAPTLSMRTRRSRA